MTFPVSALRRRRAQALWAGRDERSISGIRMIAAYSGVLVTAELLGALAGLLAGTVLDALIVPMLLGHFAARPMAAYRRLLPILALVALLRVLSIAAVYPRVPIVWWYALIGVPMLLGSFLAIRLIDEPVSRLALRATNPRLDAVIAALGVPAGLIGYALLTPPPLIVGADLFGVVFAMAILAVFGAFLEQLIYRGLLQTVALEVLGFRRAGVLYAASLCAVMYLGSGSLLFTIAMWFMSVGWGLALLRGASLWGLTLSHTFILWGMAFWWRPILG